MSQKPTRWLGNRLLCTLATLFAVLWIVGPDPMKLLVATAHADEDLEEADEAPQAAGAKPAAAGETPATEKKEPAPEKPAEDASTDSVKPGVAAATAGKEEKTKENLGQRRQGDVGKNEELSFLQSKVTSQMLELEERMYRLSEALKGLEPENASRLLIGLKYAREELIQLQMKEVQNALKSLNFRDAIVEQKQLLAKLQRLEQLLLSPDLDFQLQLERLRLMRELMKRLDGAIKEEEREKASTDQAVEIEKQLKELRKQMASLREIIVNQTGHVKAAEELTKPADAEKVDNDPNSATQSAPEGKSAQQDLGALTDGQAKTREQTEPLEKGMETIGAAGKEMDQALAQLKQAQPSNALPHQTEALELLKRALKSLEDKEKQLEAELTQEKFAAMRKDQADNRKTTEGISEAAVQLGDAGARSRTELIRASGSMSSAEGSFGSGNADSADMAQGEALASLKFAREQLAAEAEKLLNRLRNEIKKRTIEGIIQMLEGQVSIRETTQRLGPKVKDGARAVLASVTGLAGAEGKLIAIGEGLTTLIEETEFGIALPAALHSITDGMSDVKDRLAATDASEEVVELQQRIEEDLQQLLDAMKQLPSQSDGDKNKNAGNGAARERQLNRLIAELKMVRMLQVRVGRDTKDTDGKREIDKDLPAALKRKIEALHDRQEDVHDITELISIERADELR